MPSRRWLLLSHAFNMDGVASSQTVTDKIPHLLGHGIEPVVVSAPTGRRDAQVEHHQVFSPLPSGLRYEVRHFFKHRRGWRTLITALLLPVYVLERVLIPFSGNWSWFLAAWRRGARLIRVRRPELVYSSGGANSAHYAAYLLARRFGLPWIAEVHDPMIHADWKKGWAQYRWAAYVEALICRHASVAFWFTPTALARAAARHPELGARGRVLYPGANPPDTPKAPYVRGACFVLAHFGSLAPNRNLAATLQAIDLLLDQQPQWADRIRLHTYGGGWDAVSAEARARLRHPQVVEAFGRLEFDPVTGLSGRQRVRRLMDAADALLLLHNADAFSEEYFPSKLYEYLWTQRPILGLVLRNPDLAGLLRRLGHPVATGEDVDQTRAAIEGLMRRWEAQDLADNGVESPYSTARAVDQLVAWGADAVAGPPRS